MIPVTKPFLPPIEEYQQMLVGIWSRNWLTNNGPLVNDLELKLKEYLDVKHLLFQTNGTIAIQIAIKALGLKGEIITTPFSYVATTSSIVWEECTPVFSDIDPATMNIDPEKIEASITDKTTAILATHVFGNPCDINRIEKIAAKNNIKVIYDAAHAFGVKYKNKSIFEYGDISTTSFHATKLFHTIEGGAVFTGNPELLKKMAGMRNFGHDGFDKYSGVGINGKNSEFHAAMGVVNLKYIDGILEHRNKSYQCYLDKLKNFKGRFQVIDPLCTSYNFSYFPVVFQDEETNLKVIEEMNKNWIYPRRYFYPSLNTLDYVKKSDTPISEDLSKRVLCLPMYNSLSEEEN